MEKLTVCDHYEAKETTVDHGYRGRGDMAPPLNKEKGFILGLSESLTQILGYAGNSSSVALPLYSDVASYFGEAPRFAWPARKECLALPWETLLSFPMGRTGAER